MGAGISLVLHTANFYKLHAGFDLFGILFVNPVSGIPIAFI
jgi:hypothetical protein